MDVDSHERVVTSNDNGMERPLVESPKSMLVPVQPLSGDPGPSAASSSNNIAGHSIINSPAPNNTPTPTAPIITTMTPIRELSPGPRGDWYGNPMMVRSAFSDEYIQRSMAQTAQERDREREERQRRIADAMATARAPMTALVSRGTREDTEGDVSREVLDRGEGSSNSRSNGGGSSDTSISPSLKTED